MFPDILCNNRFWAHLIGPLLTWKRPRSIRFCNILQAIRVESCRMMMDDDTSMYDVFRSSGFEGTAGCAAKVPCSFKSLRNSSTTWVKGKQSSWRSANESLPRIEDGSLPHWLTAKHSPKINHDQSMYTYCTLIDIDLQCVNASPLEKVTLRCTMMHQLTLPESFSTDRWCLVAWGGPSV